MTELATTPPAPWERYQRPFVRDLAYVISCPDVLTTWLDVAPHHNTHQVEVHPPSFWHAQFEAYGQRLTELDTTNAYQALTRYLMSRPSPSRLGFHFEGLLSFWLEDGFTYGTHSYELLASNVQLFRGKQTAGELDLILYNHEAQTNEHWELAIKFFMGSYPFEPINWVGINSRDNLQRKMTHMQTKQFSSVWVDIADYGRVMIDKRYGVIKGRFFLPQGVTDFVRPDWMAGDFPLHRWYDRDNNDDLHHIDTSRLRRARYVEWFTRRDFYDTRQPPIIWEEDAPPRTGLYFEDGRPLVIYPPAGKSSQNHTQPV